MSQFNFTKLGQSLIHNLLCIIAHTIVCKYRFYKTLLMMDRWVSKYVELKPKCWFKLIHWDHICILLDYIYISVYIYILPSVVFHKFITKTRFLKYNCLFNLTGFSKPQWTVPLVRKKNPGKNGYCLLLLSCWTWPTIKENYTYWSLP